MCTRSLLGQRLLCAVAIPELPLKGRGLPAVPRPGPGVSPGGEDTAQLLLRLPPRPGAETSTRLRRPFQPRAPCPPGGQGQRGQCGQRGQRDGASGGNAVRVASRRDGAPGPLRGGGSQRDGPPRPHIRGGGSSGTRPPRPHRGGGGSPAGRGCRSPLEGGSGGPRAALLPACGCGHAEQSRARPEEPRLRRRARGAGGVAQQRPLTAGSEGATSGPGAARPWRTDPTLGRAARLG